MLDYDVVIIGGTPAGRQAALTATQMRARVALVEPHPAPAPGQIFGPNSHQTLLQAARVARQMREISQFGISWETATRAGEGEGDRSGPENINVLVRWDQTRRWIECVASNLEGLYDPAMLAARGVDVIFGNGEFTAEPKLAFAVNDRRLRSRTYLLATGSRPRLPDAEGLPLAGCLSADTVGKLTQIPARVAIVGGDPTGAELAQIFARLGSQVTLVTRSPHILGREDPEVAFLVQAQLEADGVTVLAGTPVTQARQIEDTKWIQAGDRAIEVDEIILAAGRTPQVGGLNLPGVGVQCHPDRLVLNEKLQTTNPRIYACGAIAGGYPLPHVAEYESRVALKNALYWPRLRVNYHGIPWVIYTDPPLARVGLTQKQARRRYGDRVRVSRETFRHVPKAQLLGETTGFCELVGHRDGRILGASIFGAGADESINFVAIAIREGLKMDAIADFPAVWPSLAGVAPQTAAAWVRDRRSSRSDWLEMLFDWRRSWGS